MIIYQKKKYQHFMLKGEICLKTETIGLYTSVQYLLLIKVEMFVYLLMQIQEK